MHMDVAPTALAVACDREPIHFVNCIQPHGFLLTFRRDALTIAQASSNAPAHLTVGQRLQDAFPQLHDVLALRLRELPLAGEALYLCTAALKTAAIRGDLGFRRFDVAAHCSGELIVLELEETDERPGAGLDARYPRMRSFIESMQATTSVEQLCSMIAREIRDVTGFDRALVYRFDEGWNGTVVAEDRNETLPSYLDLRFPAADIPAQARDLYRRNRLRIIPDAAYVSSPILPAMTPEGTPLDLSQSVLRSVSPVHVEYMRNMGTMASMSVSILIDGTLWGLVSCHNKSPRRVPLQARNACDFLTQIFGLQLSARERSRTAEARNHLGSIQARLLGFMAEEERFVDGLLKHPEDVLALVQANGAAIVSEDQCRLIGTTPTPDEIRGIYKWLSTTRRSDDIVACDSLGSAFPRALAFSGRAAGLLAISISQKYASYLLWFRPEIIQTVTWGGDPTKTVDDDGGSDVVLHPRKSFEMWKETVRWRSLPWSPVEIAMANDLRNSVLGIVLRRAEELAAMSEELQRANKELEAFSYSVSHDLRAPFRHIVGYSEMLRSQEGERLSDKGRRYVDTIVEAAFSAGTLVDSLLAFAQMGRHALNRVEGDMGVLVEEVRRKTLRDVPPERTIEWRIGSLGRFYGDPFVLRLAIENLLSNAVKYSRDRANAVIEIGRDDRADSEAVFFVRDNGVGFDMAYVNKLFGVFQRLHRVEDYEGTGIGLANVRRIIERHGGQTWAKGALGQGATFFFTLPARKEARHSG